jgi:hypothetical protein
MFVRSKAELHALNSLGVEFAQSKPVDQSCTP